MCINSNNDEFVPCTFKNGRCTIACTTPGGSREPNCYRIGYHLGNDWVIFRKHVQFTVLLAKCYPITTEMIPKSVTVRFKPPAREKVEDDRRISINP